MIVNAPKPPYFAVIFTSKLTNFNENYSNTANKMFELAKKQDGFLGFESAREDIGITISYWKSEHAILKWKQHPEHAIAMNNGKELWYNNYTVRVCRVEREYSFSRKKK